MGPVCQYDVGLQADQLPRERSYPIVVIAMPTNVHPHAASVIPPDAGSRVNPNRHNRRKLHGGTVGEHRRAGLLHEFRETR